MTFLNCEKLDDKPVEDQAIRAAILNHRQNLLEAAGLVYSLNEGIQIDFNLAVVGEGSNPTKIETAEEQILKSQSMLLESMRLLMNVIKRFVERNPHNQAEMSPSIIWLCKFVDSDLETPPCEHDKKESPEPRYGENKNQQLFMDAKEAAKAAIISIIQANVEECVKIADNDSSLSRRVLELFAEDLNEDPKELLWSFCSHREASR